MKRKCYKTCPQALYYLRATNYYLGKEKEVHSSGKNICPDILDGSYQFIIIISQNKELIICPPVVGLYLQLLLRQVFPIQK